MHNDIPSSPASIVPAANDYEGWRLHWQARGMPWRTEPEIDKERQQYLAERQVIESDIEKAIYPFFDVAEKVHIRLDRADVEWLLAEHLSRGKSGTVSGAVSWANEQQGERKGLDLRGADLQAVNLRGLPLAGLRAGLTYDERRREPLRLRENAVVNVQDADLSESCLQGATFSRAHCERALFRNSNLSGVTANFPLHSIG